MRILTVGLVLLSALIHHSLHAQTVDGPSAEAYPIIAQLYDDPGRYANRTVMIYGVVVEAEPRSTFMLQDVSQHPLRIVGSEKLKAAVGDQLIVIGVLHTDAEKPYLSAQELIATRVVAGGGCC
jgi:hypothetical protein